MKLKLDYSAGKHGYDLKIQLEVDIEEDAEALGYATAVLFEAAKKLSELMEKQIANITKEFVLVHIKLKKKLPKQRIHIGHLIHLS